MMTRNKLYSLVLILSMAGYAWLFWNYKHAATLDTNLQVCLFHRITGVPCPSCGNTHALVYLMQGNIHKAIITNLLSPVLAVMLLVFPAWIVVDLLRKRNNFMAFYKKTETFLKNRWVALPSIVFVLIIWIINIKNQL